MKQKRIVYLVSDVLEFLSIVLIFTLGGFVGGFINYKLVKSSLDRQIKATDVLIREMKERVEKVR